MIFFQHMSCRLLESQVAKLIGTPISPKMLAIGLWLISNLTVNHLILINFHLMQWKSIKNITNILLIIDQHFISVTSDPFCINRSQIMVHLSISISLYTRAYSGPTVIWDHGYYMGQYSRLVKTHYDEVWTIIMFSTYNDES